MIEIRWKLADYLQQHGLTAYRLAKAIGSDTRAATIYRLARRGEEPSRVDLPTLQNVIMGLRNLTGESVTLDDLFEIADTPEPQSSDRQTALTAAQPFHWSALKHHTDPEAEDFTPVLRELRERDRQLAIEQSSSSQL